MNVIEWKATIITFLFWQILVPSQIMTNWSNDYMEGVAFEMIFCAISLATGILANIYLYVCKVNQVGTNP